MKRLAIFIARLGGNTLVLSSVFICPLILANAGEDNPQDIAVLQSYKQIAQKYDFAICVLRNDNNVVTYYINGRPWSIDKMIDVLLLNKESSPNFQLCIVLDSKDDLLEDCLFLKKKLNDSGFKQVQISKVDELREAAAIIQDTTHAIENADLITDDKMMAMVEAVFALPSLREDDNNIGEKLSMYKDFLEKYKKYDSTNVYSTVQKLYNGFREGLYRNPEPTTIPGQNKSESDPRAADPGLSTRGIVTGQDIPVADLSPPPGVNK